MNEIDQLFAESDKSCTKFKVSQKKPAKYVPSYVKRAISDVVHELTTCQKYSPVTYLMKSGMHVKIGRTTKGGLKSRLSCIQTGNPLEVELVCCIDGDYESELHEMFSEHRHRGEWFHADGEIFRFFSNAVKNK